jgi:very-short-patch-repair endonuclease
MCQGLSTAARLFHRFGSSTVDAFRVNTVLRSLLESRQVATRRELLQVVSEHVIDHAIRRGELERVLPRTYVRAGEQGRDRTLVLRAALQHLDGRGALSHTTAVKVWDLPVPDDMVVHVTVPVTCQPRSAGPAVVHRRRGFAVGLPQTVVRNGLEVVRLERSIIESWGVLPEDDGRRAPVIAAVAGRRTTCERLFAEAAAIPNLRGRAPLLGLVELLRDGCRSELEVWGHLHVFAPPDLPSARRQLPVQLGGRTVYLDLAYEDEKVNVELDGAKYHFGTANRERDMRRDATLARLGWLTLRFSHDRLVTDPEGVRRELLAVLASRRQQLGMSAKRPRSQLNHDHALSGWPGAGRLNALLRSMDMPHRGDLPRFGPGHRGRGVGWGTGLECRLRDLAACHTPSMRRRRRRCTPARGPSHRAE